MNIFVPIPRVYNTSVNKWQRYGIKAHTAMLHYYGNRCKLFIHFTQL